MRTVRSRLLLLVALFPRALTAAAEEEAAARPPFAVFERSIEGFESPLGVAVAPEGTIVVADTGHHAIRWFDRAGNPLQAAGRRGAGPGEFLLPAGVAVLASGEIVVADTGNHRIQILTREGRAAREFGGLGDGPGRFHSPSGVAAMGDRIAVADAGNARVQVISADGTPILTIGGFGDAKDSFLRPEAVAFGASGRLFVADSDRHRILSFDAGGTLVADSDRHRILSFDAGGTLVAEWGGLGPHRGLLAAPAGLAVSGGVLYVADCRNHRVQAFDPDRGTPLGEWGVHAILPREGKGALHYPDRVAVAPGGAFGVVLESFENRVQIFAPPEAPAPAPPRAPAGGSVHFGPGIGAAGSVAALIEPEKEAIDLYDLRSPQPVLVTTFGVPGFGPGKLLRPSDAALFADGRRLAVADAGSRRVHVYAIAHDPAAPLRFDPFLSRFARSVDFASPAARFGNARFVPEPVAVAAGDDGRLHVLDARNGRVIVLGPDLLPVFSYGRDLVGATDVALDADGTTALVVDSLAGVVRAFDTRTGAEKTATATGDGEGGLERPFGVAIAADGRRSITDAALHRIVEFDRGGRFLRAFGREGVGAGEFFKPRGIARDARGRLLVVDHGNHRVQIFAADGAFDVAFGSRAYVDSTRPARERE